MTSEFYCVILFNHVTTLCFIVLYQLYVFIVLYRQMDPIVVAHTTYEDTFIGAGDPLGVSSSCTASTPEFLLLLLFIDPDRPPNTYW